MKEIFSSTYAIGFYFGLVFAALALYRVIRLKFELRGYKRHLSNKLEIDAEQLQKMKRDQDALKKENENLRVKVASLNDNPDRRAQRDLEIFARAEKRMLVSVPGFAPAWEGAKSAAQTELADEEAGRSAPKSVFSKIFGGRVENVETAKTLTDSRPSQQP
jgi:cell division protein FtsB